MCLFSFFLIFLGLRERIEQEDPAHLLENQFLRPTRHTKRKRSEKMDVEEPGSKKRRTEPRK